MNNVNKKRSKDQKYQKHKKDKKKEPKKINFHYCSENRKKIENKEKIH
jgi:hypothetical protein